MERPKEDSMLLMWILSVLQFHIWTRRFELCAATVYLAVTATDLAPLCGVHEKACIRKYGGKPLRTEYCHELGVRLLVGCVASIAARHGIGIRVVFSYCSAHYVRIYVQIAYGAKKADDSLKNIGIRTPLFQLLPQRNNTKTIP